MESFEKLLVLVCSHELKGVVRSISLILESDLLAVTSDGFVVYQINRTLASLNSFSPTSVAGTRLDRRTKGIRAIASIVLVSYSK